MDRSLFELYAAYTAASVGFAMVRIMLGRFAANLEL